jgi:xylulose-5-phosphate/fructose-6-phosphate phosphoketolase
MDVIDRVPGLAERAGAVRRLMSESRVASRDYTRRHGEDSPEISQWSWPY